MTSNLSASSNYIWSLNSVLGKGATGYVYQGSFKTNGETVAVKTFNQASKLRPDQVQIREFEVLRRVDHENIVKLLAVEEEVKTHSRVLIMEECTGGSLFSILDEPENTYGLVEDEFLLVLKHTSNGMKHLRDNNIVHRDLKPGNIMKYIAEDGRSVYKLTDFGAARELEDDQQFVSLYGTEEYLHPDLYERAVLKKEVRKSFGATVDLWSIGVTLYHVATGSLPFRPYGGRKNCETMYQITTQKVSGIISGVQSVLKGPIEWSDQLPSTCQLSVGLKKFITPILAGLMESNPNLMWSFDHFFTEVTVLNVKRRVFIFFVDECQLLTLYVDSSDKLFNFRLLIQEQTGVIPDQQRLFFRYKNFDEIVDSETIILNYPQTSLKEPIFLVGSMHPVVNYTEQVPNNFPNFLPAIAVDQDAITSKLICSNGYFVKRSIEKTELIFNLIKYFAKTMNAVYKDEFIKLKSTISQAESNSASANQKMKMLQSRHKTTTLLLDLFENSKSTIAEERNKLNLLVNSKQESSSTVIKQFNTVRNQLLSAYQRVVIEEQLYNQWKNMPSFKNDLSKCPDFANTYVRTLRNCFTNFDRFRKQRASPYMHSEQHFSQNLLERLRTERNKQKLCRVYREDCLPVLQEAVGDLGHWLNLVQNTLNIEGTREDLQRLVDMLCAHDSTLDKANETYDEIVQSQIAKVLPQRLECPGRSDSISSTKSVKSSKLIMEKLKLIDETHFETLDLLKENQSIMNKLQEVSLAMSETFDRCKN